MADRSTQLILGALSHALAQGEAVPLHGSRSAPGLFPGNAAGKAAAQRCQQEGWLSADLDGSLITEKGMRYLLDQVTPHKVLEDLVRVLETRQDEVTRLVASVQRMQASLEGLRANAERVLAQIETPPTPNAAEPVVPANLSRLFAEFQKRREEPVPTSDLPEAILHVLRQWPTGANEDCSLPHLYRQVLTTCPRMTVGAFHDALRGLGERVTLHPWTGPLYAMPEPAVALLHGHSVAYYASLRATS